MHPKLTDDDSSFLGSVEDLTQSADVVRIGMRRDDEVDLAGLVVLGKMLEDGVGSFPETSVQQDYGLPLSLADEIPISKQDCITALAFFSNRRGRAKRCVKGETAYLSIGDITHTSRGGDPGKGTPSHEGSYAGKQVEVQ